MEETRLRLGLAQDGLSRQLAWVAAADSKIPPVFAIDAAMLASLAAVLPDLDALATEAAMTSAMAGAGLLCSIACLAVAALPRLKGPKGSMVYFEGLTSIKSDDYVSRVLEGRITEFIRDIAEQAYRNAEIASRKYKAVRWAIVLLFASVPFWLMSLLLLYAAK